MKIFNKIKKSPVFIYTIVFFIVFSLFYLMFIKNNKSLIWDADGIRQHYSILYNFNETIRNFIKNPGAGFPEWSWTIGYGNDLMATYSYYVLGDLFDYISLLFPLNKLELVFNLLILIRLYCVGIAFILYAKKMKFSKYASILGSISYAFSGFIFMSAIKHPYFINPLIILPLAFICIENVLQNRKKYMFSIIVAIAMISNFYFFYMIAIISLIYAFLRYVELYKKEGLKFWKYLLNLIIYFAIGLLISGIVLAPTLYTILNSSRLANESSQASMILYPISYYLNLIYGSISGGSYPFWVVLVFPILTIILLPIAFRNRKEYKTYFYMIIIFSVMLLFPIVGKAMNGFLSISNRWTFAFAFMASVIISVGYDNIKNICKKDIFWMIAIIIFYILFGLIQFKFTDFKNNMLPSIIIGIIIVGIIIYNYKNKGTINNKWMFIYILILLSANIVINNYYRYNPNDDNYIGQFMQKGKALNYYKKSFDGAEKYIKKNDKSFYRIAKADNISRNNTRNNSLVLNYNGIDSYLSVNNSNLSEFANTLNNRSFTPNSPIINFDNRALVSNIMGVKYYIGKSSKNPHFDPSIKKIKDVGKFSVYEKENGLPFGYVYSNILDENKFDLFNGLEKEESLVYAAAISSKYAKSNINNINTKINNINFDTKSSTANIKKNEIVVTKANQKVILNIKNNTIPAGELFVNLGNLKYVPKNKEIKLDNIGKYDAFKLKASYKDISKTFDQRGSLDGSDSFTMDATLINLGYYKEESNNGQKIILTFDKPGKYTFDSLNVFSMPVEEYNNEINKLKENSMKIDNILNDKVIGTIDSKVDGVITFQIPYSKGWTLKIDGKETNTFPVNKAFLGANLNKGNHSIELTYRTPFLRIGLVCSFVGIIILIAISLLGKKSINKKIK
ncbi:YfhO family protein [Clostridium sp. Ade.TY]|uniref:YfhO family protein n=1 Tax=Clostridium sp. Ade.TY TaxID=1391647 RepID=UPI0003F4B894|nr:YfhO family protein [Clostridium sp. Ade.TY]